MLPVESIKQLAGFSREDKAGFDRALTELQMRMFITVCGAQRKLSKKGGEYGMSSTIFCTTERFFGADVFEKAASIKPEAARDKIMTQALKLSPHVPEKKMLKFIHG